MSRDVIRKKEERYSKLVGVHCACCEGWYEALSSWGVDAPSLMRKHSRHRVRPEEVNRCLTPPRFWDMSFDDAN